LHFTQKKKKGGGQFAFLADFIFTSAACLPFLRHFFEKPEKRSGKINFFRKRKSFTFAGEMLKLVLAYLRGFILNISAQN
jgi:hypothetical protein